SFESKPSISVRIWSSVCSRSSLAPVTEIDPWRERPIASSSSMKMIAGAASLALANRSRTREAPTPTIASMNSDAAIEKKAACASPATARATSVLPVPGAEAHVPVGRLQEVDDLRELGLRLVDPGHVVERDLDRRGVDPPRLRPPEVPEPSEAAAGPGGTPAEEHEQCDQENRRPEPEQDLGQQRRAGVRVLRVDLDALRLQQLGQRDVVPE